MTLASILVPGLIWGTFALGVLVIAAVIARKSWRMLDAERRANEVPVRLLREQGELLDELLGIEVMGIPAPEDLRDRMMAVNRKYLDYTHALKGKR